MQEYNLTYDMRHKKYPLNLPIGMYEKAKAKAKKGGFLELAPYLRAIIYKEVNDGKLCLKDILGTKEARRQAYLEDQEKLEIQKVNGFSDKTKIIRNLIDRFSGRC